MIKKNILALLLAMAVICGISSTELSAGVVTGSADTVLGQGNFTQGYMDFIDGNGLSAPYDVAIDTDSGKVYVTEYDNHRVLWWNNIDSLTNGDSADGVLGQADFYSISANRGGAVAANTLKNPNGITIDGSGNVWVADYGNNRVLRYNAPLINGMDANLVLGQQSFIINAVNDSDGDGSNDFAASTNTLSYPPDVALDGSGNIWVADKSNSRILKYNAGSLATGMDANLVLGQQGFTLSAANDSDGDGVEDSVSTCTVYRPYSVDVDTAGNVWVADTVNNRVLKYNAGSLATGMDANLVLGQQSFTINARNDSDGNGATDSVAANTLYSPYGVTVDASGNVVVGDSSNHRVLRYNTPSSNGMNANLVLGQQSFTINARNDSDGNGATDSVAANTLYYPYGVATDGSGNIWVADKSNNRVLKYNKTTLATGMDANLVLGQAIFTRNVKNYVDGKGFYNPNRVAFDAESGKVYVADYCNHRVLWWNNIGSLTNGDSADGVLGQADFYSTSANRGSTVKANTLNNPVGVTVDASGNVLVADNNNNRMLRYDAPLSNGMDADLVLGQADFTSNGSGVTASNFNGPYDVAIDVSGNVWIIEETNCRALRFNTPLSNGMNASLVLGQADFTSNNNDVTVNGLGGPCDVAVDSSGNVWVADTDVNRVLRYNAPLSNGMDADLVLGQQSFTISAANDSDGDGVTDSVAANTLKNPYSVATDDSGNIWVADRENNRILKYNAGSLATGIDAEFVLGQPDLTSNGSDVTASTLKSPADAALDGSGNIWVADMYNNRILKYNTILPTSITPDSAENTGSVNITNLAGTEFAAGLTVKLTKTGQTDITGTNVSVVSANKITCTFDLTGKAVGYWNSVITYENFTGTLSNAFEIKEEASEDSITVVIDKDSDNTVKFQPETGEITIEIPAHSFTETVSMTVEIADVPAADRSTIKTTDIGINIELSNKSLQPGKEITISINYRDSDIEGLDESKLVLARYDPVNSRWIPLPSTVYANENKGVGITDHLSKFALIQLTAAATLDSVKVFPNPYDSARHSQGIIFDNLTAEVEIKIYTVSGELVKKLNESDGNGRTTWDGKNSAGNDMASGVYIAVLKDSSDTKKLKIAIEK